MINSFKNLIEGVWKILNKLEMVQVQDATLKVNSEEIKNYTKRKEVEKMDRKKKERIDKQRAALGIRTRKR